MKREAVLVLDFAGQYKQLIARRVRELNVFCEVKPHSTTLAEIKAGNYQGIIFTGGPHSVNDEQALLPDPAIFELGIPILGICYGAQVISKMLGGQVGRLERGEYGKTVLMLTDSALFAGLDTVNSCWMSHFDTITELPPGFVVSASSPTCPNAALEDAGRKIYACQFHPEVQHTPDGSKMLRNFLYQICQLKGEWQMSSYVNEQVAAIRQQVGERKVLCALSGGVDSSVAAVMVHKAIGKQLYCIFVDHGLLRKNEGDEVERVFRQQFDMNLKRVNAEERFLARLQDVSDPEQKRKIIGEEFIRVFEEEAALFEDCDFLVQGTIYPDVIESGVGGAVIKSHHNVGGLPEDIRFTGLIEPLRELFKDEVRQAGLELGIPADLVWRQPFPGPGLAIRCLGAVSKERLDVLREADAIFREEIFKAGLYRELGQYFAVLTNLRSVGVQGDERSYDYTVALRAVNSSDFMTADWARLPYELLDLCSRRIINEVRGVNRLVYDITSKPPATIEWE